jgi:hypothetical protein
MCIHRIESTGSAEIAWPSSILSEWWSCAVTVVLRSSAAAATAFIRNPIAMFAVVAGFRVLKVDVTIDQRRGDWATAKEFSIEKAHSCVAPACLRERLARSPLASVAARPGTPKTSSPACVFVRSTPWLRVRGEERSQTRKMSP